MLTRRILAGTTAAALLTGVTLLAAAPTASAASSTVLDCSTSSTVTWALSPGGSLQFDAASSCTSLGIYVPGTMGVVASSNPAFVFPNPQNSTGVTPLPANPWTYTAPTESMCSNAEFYLSGSGGTVTVVVDNCPGATSSTSAAAPIPNWDLAYERRGPNAPCLPNFSPSWAQWPNDGTGGYTCERTIPAFGSTSWRPGITRSTPLGVHDQVAGD